MGQNTRLAGQNGSNAEFGLNLITNGLGKSWILFLFCLISDRKDFFPFGTLLFVVLVAHAQASCTSVLEKYCARNSIALVAVMILNMNPVETFNKLTFYV